MQPVRPEYRAATPADRKLDTPAEPPAATTGGTLRAAYAQFIVNPDTNDVVVRIRDASTDEVLSELPSKDVQAMTQHLKDYADALARRRATGQTGSGS